MPGETANLYRVLIADDDEAFRETLKCIFEPYLHLFEAASGEEAIQLAEQHPVDIALLDMYMKVLTGLETLRILKSFNSVVPCILITANTTDELRRNAERAQVYTVLRKPISKAKLVTTVSAALRDVYNDPNPLPKLCS